mgnify:CR=1 FL=1
MSTLMDFRYKRKYVAAPGVDGQGGRKSGKDGESLTIRVPRGTLIRDAETGEIIKDMSDSEPFVLCKGGRGGWGNQHFATPTRPGCLASLRRAFPARATTWCWS